MKNATRMLAVLLALAMIFAFMGCTGEQAERKPSKPKRETVTEAPDAENKDAPDAEETETETETGAGTIIGNSESQMTAEELETIIPDCIEIAKELAPEDIAATIAQAGTDFSMLSTDNARDFGMQFGSAILHFYVGILGEDAGKVQFIHCLFSKNDEAKYYIAALVSIHYGIPPEAALAATEKILEEQTEDNATASTSDGAYAEIITDLGETYMILAGYIAPYANDKFYQDRVDANSGGMVIDRFLATQDAE